MLRSQALWARYTELLGGFGPQVVQDLPSDPGPLSYLLTTAVVMPLRPAPRTAVGTDRLRPADGGQPLPAAGGHDHVGRPVTAPAGRGLPAELTSGPGARVRSPRGVRRSSRKWPISSITIRTAAKIIGAISTAIGVCRVIGVIGALIPGVQLVLERGRPEPGADPPGDQPGHRRADQPGDTAQPPAYGGSAAARPPRAQRRRPAPRIANQASCEANRLSWPVQVDPAVDDLGGGRRRDPPPQHPPHQAGSQHEPDADQRPDEPVPGGRRRRPVGGTPRRARRRLGGRYDGLARGLAGTAGATGSSEGRLTRPG